MREVAPDFRDAAKEAADSKVLEPPAGRWFEAAATLSWTRDPFDRLIVGHALARQWKLATADACILDHVVPTDRRALSAYA